MDITNGLFNASPALGMLLAILSLMTYVIFTSTKRRPVMFHGKPARGTCSICAKTDQVIEVTFDEPPRFSGVVCLKDFARMVRNRQNNEQAEQNGESDEKKIPDDPDSLSNP